MGSEKYISTRFREMFKLFKSAKKQQSFQWLDALSEQVFGEWMHFQIYLSLWELQVIRDWFCVRDVTEKSLKRLLMLLILKN